MANHLITTLPIPDKHLHMLFEKLESISGNKSHIKVIGINDSFSLSDETIKSILNLNVFTIKHVSLSGQYYSVSYKQNRQAGNNDEEPHPYFSVINIYSQDHPPPEQSTIISIVEGVQSYLVKNKLLPGIIAKAGSEATSGISATLSAIQLSSADQVARVNEFFANLVTRFDDKYKVLEAETQAQRDRLSSEFIQKEESLKAEKVALEERRKQLDDSDNTHARRATKLELLKTLQQRQQSLSISGDTKTLRWPIHGVFLVLLAGTLVGAIWSLYVWGNSPSAAWSDATTVTSAVKTIVFTFGFLTSAGLYISWMNRWFDKHADAQFATKQYEIDINRATWAVEAALEWQRSQGGEMPQALINGITNNLFQHEKGESAEYSPLEALASSILGSAANMKVNMNGSEVAFDRKSIKSMK